VGPRAGAIYNDVDLYTIIRKTLVSIFNVLPVFTRRLKTGTYLIRQFFRKVSCTRCAVTLVRTVGGPNSGCCYPQFEREVGRGQTSSGSCIWRWKTFGFQQVYGRVYTGFEADSYEQRSLALSLHSQVIFCLHRCCCKREPVSGEICFCHTGYSAAKQIFKYTFTTENDGEIAHLV
jgi:hypothetical protein